MKTPKNIQELQFMLDFETLGLTTDTIVLSVAVVPFGIFSDGTSIASLNLPVFYERFDFTKQTDRLIDLDTVKFWMKQSNEAREEAFSGIADIEETLQKLKLYIADQEVMTNCIYSRLWGKGSDFDNKILENLYEQYDLEFPFSFRDNRCFRTLQELFPKITVSASADNVKHNALHDAQLQAERATLILQHIHRMENSNGQ